MKKNIICNLNVNLKKMENLHSKKDRCILNKTFSVFLTGVFSTMSISGLGLEYKLFFECDTINMSDIYTCIGVVAGSTLLALASGLKYIKYDEENEQINQNIDYLYNDTIGLIDNLDDSKVLEK